MKDSTEYVFQLRQALASLAQAKAQLDLINRGARSEDVAAAKEMMETAKANYESARKDFDRFNELNKTNSITAKQFDDAKTRKSVTEGQYNQANEAYKKSVNGSRTEEKELAKGRYDQTLAQVDLAKKKLRDCSIKAPSDGFVTKISVETGELVNPGTQIGKLTDLSEVPNPAQKLKAGMVGDVRI
ncbi:MAG: hypothetical protein K8R21_13500 [Leptospira sp.]|nr:hypothetical protein [Leptospira sp.]